MTHFLASVRSRAEAELVLAAGVDIIDLKEPNKGALGAVAADVIRDCVEAIAGQKPISATVGDLPMVPGSVSEAIVATAGLGVDTVKLGVTSEGDVWGCLDGIRALNLSANLVLVFFADAPTGVDPIEAAMACGARGVMLDTVGKTGGSLIDHMLVREVGRFVHRAQKAGLQAGVAGSLRTRHIEPLLELRPDVIGFRGALCEQGERGLSLDPKACTEIRALVAGGINASEVRFEEHSTSAMW